MYQFIEQAQVFQNKHRAFYNLQFVMDGGKAI